MKIIAIIPVHGRLPLLKLTIERLYFKNKIHHVICIGEEENKKTCNDAGAEFIVHPNKPIGKKLNVGFLRAKELKPDAVSFVGSSDWLCDTWFDITGPLAEKYEIIGKRDFNMAHINESIHVSVWPGYPLGSCREREPIGIGRVCSASFMDKVEWMPFEDHLNNSLDYSMMLAMQKHNGTCFIYNSPEIQSLSISCEKWTNMHKFEKLSNGLVLRMPEVWLQMWFPEIFILKNNL